MDSGVDAGLIQELAASAQTLILENLYPLGLSQLASRPYNNFEFLISARLRAS
jgi:hypothetical protein